MTYNKPQHSGEHSCTPFPILREGDTSGIVTYIDLVKLGNIDSFGVDLTKLGGDKRWDNSSIDKWEILFEAIDAHLKLFDEKLTYLEGVVFPDNILINVDTNNNTLTANIDDVTWSSNSNFININPTIGKTTTYSLSNSATVTDIWELSVDQSQINLGESVTITATWIAGTEKYDAIITASKSGMTDAKQDVSLIKTSVNPGFVTLDNNLVINLDSNGIGSASFKPTQAGVSQIKIKNLENSPSVEITVIDNTPQVTYYWYGGAGPIDSYTVPGQGDEWHLIEGTPTSIETGDLYNPIKINWTLAVPTEFGLNHISNGEDITDTYDVTTVTCADGVAYKVFSQISATKRTNVSIIQ